MLKVVGISFKPKGRIYYFSPGNLSLKKQDAVIVETDRGLQFGQVEEDMIEIEEEKLKLPLKNVVRLATKKDRQKHNKKLEDAKEAIKKCRELIQKYNLKMYIIDSSFTFEREQLLFHFLADSRVDFRSLARDLASIYHTRIELRQIGVRDKAKEIGGMGICGRQLCCASFLSEFDSVSINMAKNQSIALNPSKINGVCGRLLCCLKYEDDNYTASRKGMPKIGTKVETEKGEGTVSSIDILNRKYHVLVPNFGDVEVLLDEKC